MYNIEIDSILNKPDNEKYLNALKKYKKECTFGKSFMAKMDTLLIVKNVGNNINSKFADFGSFLVNDSLLYFTSKRTELGANGLNEIKKAISLQKHSNTTVELNF